MTPYKRGAESVKGGSKSSFLCKNGRGMVWRGRFSWLLIKGEGTESGKGGSQSSPYKRGGGQSVKGERQA